MVRFRETMCTCNTTKIPKPKTTRKPYIYDILAPIEVLQYVMEASCHGTSMLGVKPTHLNCIF